MFVASGLYRYATSPGTTTSHPSSSTLTPTDEHTPANTRVKRRPKRVTVPSAANHAKSPLPSPSTSSLPHQNPLLADSEVSLPPPPPYASIATGSTNQERKQAQEAKVAIIEEILKEEDLYKLLGCKKTAKPEEIRRGFLNRSRSCHPDKFPNYPPATSAFQKVSFAYETLSKPSSRRMYDVSGRSDFAAAMNNGDAPHYSSAGGMSGEDTLNGVLYSVFCEFMEGDFEMIRVLVNALNEGNPSMSLGEEAVDSIEGAFKRLREIMLAGKRYLSIIKFELMRLHEIQQSLRQLSYFNITGRLKLTIQLARVTINIPLAIDHAMKGQEEAEKAREDYRDDNPEDDDDEEGEDEHQYTSTSDDFGIAPEDEDEDAGIDDDHGDSLLNSRRRPSRAFSSTSAWTARAGGSAPPGGGDQNTGGVGRRGTIRGSRRRDRIHGGPANATSLHAKVQEGDEEASRTGQEDHRPSLSSSSSTSASRGGALQRRGLLPHSAVSLLKGVVKVLETSEAWMPGTGVPNSEESQNRPLTP